MQVVIAKNDGSGIPVIGPTYKVSLAIIKLIADFIRVSTLEVVYGSHFGHFFAGRPLTYACACCTENNCVMKPDQPRLGR